MATIIKSPGRGFGVVGGFKGNSTIAAEDFTKAFWRGLFIGLLAIVATVADSASGYHLLKKIPIPGDGGWDYVSVDSVNRRVYVSHGTQLEVLDADCGAIVGMIVVPLVEANNQPIQRNVRGAAMAPEPPALRGEGKR